MGIMVVPYSELKPLSKAIGGGGFGVVKKGNLNGIEVAVKISKLRE